MERVIHTLNINTIGTFLVLVTETHLSMLFTQYIPLEYFGLTLYKLQIYNTVIILADFYRTPATLRPGLPYYETIIF